LFHKNNKRIEAEKEKEPVSPETSYDTRIVDLAEGFVNCGC